MFKKCFLKLFVGIFLTFTVPFDALAQNDELGTPSVGGPRKQLATIVFSGLGGAVLGLSTLSFYGRPQDKLSNIAVGFAIGIITGTIYTTYKQATQPYGALAVEREIFYADLDKGFPTDAKSLFTLSEEWTF